MIRTSFLTRLGCAIITQAQAATIGLTSPGRMTAAGLLFEYYTINA